MKTHDLMIEKIFLLAMKIYFERFIPRKNGRAQVFRVDQMVLHNRQASINVLNERNFLNISITSVSLYIVSNY